MARERIACGDDLAGIRRDACKAAITGHISADDLAAIDAEIGAVEALRRARRQTEKSGATLRAMGPTRRRASTWKDRRHVRRRRAALGFVPVKMADAFTPGEFAVVGVIGEEIMQRGKSCLSVKEIADRSGVCRAIAQRAQRLAAALGLIVIEERRVSRMRNLTNVIRIRAGAVGRRWRTWLKRRLKRAGGGPTFVSGSNTRESRSGSQTAVERLDKAIERLIVPHGSHPRPG
ncbi:hypothetical protein [Jannaschia sp. LMIT008]|uniref:hypothetical protein n=1 Tax=Jannaschia maritima TaxID=3032585 RepID=UPI0028125581|nr:hypothetical protein [Jannaschia sp. LMIT008]